MKDNCIHTRNAAPNHFNFKFYIHDRWYIRKLNNEGFNTSPVFISVLVVLISDLLTCFPIAADNVYRKGFNAEFTGRMRTADQA